MQKEIKKTNKKNFFIKNKIYIIILLGAFISILLGIIAGNCFAKYQENILINATAKIAKPILEIKTGKIAEIGNNDKISIYSFEIENYENENINQVDMEYDIEILASGNENIKYKLYKNNELIELQDYKTQKFELKKDEKEIQKYKIEIEQNCNQNNETTKENIYVKINSNQII